MQKKEIVMENKMKCEYCQKRIPARKGLIIHFHNNIQQKPIYHYFCTKECKMCWIFNRIQFGKQLIVGDFF